MRLVSAAFSDHQQIPKEHAYKTGNLSPPLMIIDAPKNARSLALIVHDPDAPVGNFTHWLMWNIDPQVTKFKSGEIPKDAVQGINDFGNSQYDGPAPPSGIHRYVFELYALDVSLNLPAGSDRLALNTAMQEHIVASARLIGTYGTEQVS